MSEGRGFKSYIGRRSDDCDCRHFESQFCQCIVTQRISSCKAGLRKKCLFSELMVKGFTFKTIYPLREDEKKPDKHKSNPIFKNSKLTLMPMLLLLPRQRYVEG